MPQPTWTHIAQVQTQVRQRILRAFVRRGLIDKGDRDEMLCWEHGGGFSLDASVRIEGTDRPRLERLLTAPVHPLRWSICIRSMPNTCSTTTQSPVPIARANWYSPRWN